MSSGAGARSKLLRATYSGPGQSELGTEPRPGNGRIHFLGPAREGGRCGKWLGVRPGHARFTVRAGQALRTMHGRERRTHARRCARRRITHDEHCSRRVFDPVYRRDYHLGLPRLQHLVDRRPRGAGAGLLGGSGCRPGRSVWAPSGAPRALVRASSITRGARSRPSEVRSVVTMTPGPRNARITARVTSSLSPRRRSGVLLLFLAFLAGGTAFFAL